MGRKSDIGFYASKRGFFTTYKGQRYRLKTCDVDDSPDGPNFTAAQEEFKRIKADVRPVMPGDMTAGAAVRRWVEHLETGSLSTVVAVRSLFKGFLAAFGKVDVRDLRNRHVFEWIDSNKEWAISTRYNALMRVKSCFAWNAHLGYISADPLATLFVPSGWKQVPRDERFVLPDDLAELLLSTAKGIWRDFLTGLARTGARPAELANATRKNYDPERHRIVHRGNPAPGDYRHKNARKTGKDRFIYLDPETEEIVRRNARAGSLLFPAKRGTRWYNSKIFCRWRSLLKQRAVSDWLAAHCHERRHVIPYSFRHTFITDRIKRGQSIALIADLCGTSVRMIEKHYSHALSDPDAMYDAFNAFR